MTVIKILLGMFIGGAIGLLVGYGLFVKGMSLAWEVMAERSGGVVMFIAVYPGLQVIFLLAGAVAGAAAVGAAVGVYVETRHKQRDRIEDREALTLPKTSTTAATPPAS